MRDDLRTSKLARVDADHVAALSNLVRSWRQGPGGHRTVPWFDPDGGGVRARVLLLMEAPGPRPCEMAMRGSARRRTPTPPTVPCAPPAKGPELRQHECLNWNVVPWTPTGSDGRWAAPRVPDLESARPALVAMLRELPELRAVITFGAPALTGLMRALTLGPPMMVVPVLGVPHPSQRNARHHEESQRRIATAFAWASCRAHDGTAPSS